MADHGEEATTRGASLRELRRFLKEHDKVEGYAGLRRVGGDDGAALWTAILKETEVAAQLEKRAEERQSEERRHEMFITAQTRAQTSPEMADAVWKEVAWKEAAEARFRNALEAALAEAEAAHAKTKAAHAKTEVCSSEPKFLDVHTVSLICCEPLLRWQSLLLSRRRSCEPSCNER